MINILRKCSLIILISFLFNCEKNQGPIYLNDTEILPLELNNSWYFKNTSTGDTLILKVNEMSSFNNQELFILNKGDFTQGFLKLFYRNNDLYGLYGDTTAYKIFSKEDDIYFYMELINENVKVEVPAGIFNTILIEISATTNLTTSTNKIWYAYGIGPVKNVRSVIHSDGSKTEKVYVLESFNLN